MGRVVLQTFLAMASQQFDSHGRIVLHGVLHRSISKVALESKDSWRKLMGVGSEHVVFFLQLAENTELQLLPCLLVLPLHVT